MLINYNFQGRKLAHSNNVFNSMQKCWSPSPHACIQTTLSWIWLGEGSKHGVVIGQFGMRARDNKNFKSRWNHVVKLVGSRSIYHSLLFRFSCCYKTTSNGNCFGSRENNPGVFWMARKRNRSKFAFQVWCSIVRNLCKDLWSLIHWILSTLFESQELFYGGGRTRGHRRSIVRQIGRELSRYRINLFTKRSIIREIGSRLPLKPCKRPYFEVNLNTVWSWQIALYFN